MEPRELKQGDVVQLNPKMTANPFFRGALMVVTERKTWGVVGFVHGLERGVAYYRAVWKEIEYVGAAPFAAPVPEGEEKVS